jgi:nuclear autoantigenic sperm protein
MLATGASDLAECHEIVSKTCGETADECAEAYYYYRKALLDLSCFRLENGIISNALDGADVNAEDKMDSNNPEIMSNDEKLEQHDNVAKLHAQ